MSISKSKALAPVLFAAFLGAAAPAANALDFTCYDTAEIKTEMVKEHLAPVVKYFETRNDQGDLGQTLYIMNPDTHKGYRMQRGYDEYAGKMCILASVDYVGLYNNASLDSRAYLDAPHANDKDTGINNVIYSASVVDHQNPIFRAVEHSPFLKTTRVTYVVANPATNEGSVYSSSLDGTWVKKYTKAIPSPLTAHVEHGAELTNTGKLLTAQAPTSPIAAGQTVALNP